MTRYLTWGAVCMLLVSGCSQVYRYSSVPEKYFRPVVVMQSMQSDYILSCLQGTRELTAEEFTEEYAATREKMEEGSNINRLRFICLGLNRHADQQQFAAGRQAFAAMLEEQSDPGEDIRGLKILIDRLDEEINTRWSAWRTLLEEKKALGADVEVLQGNLEQARIKNQELEKKIEQLKNIEEIMKRRETNQP